MALILVAGATGQLGLAAVKELLSRGMKVRALIRDPQAAPRFRALGAEPVVGDMTQRDTLITACQGVTEIIATANVAVPSRPEDTFESVERYGYRNLVGAATEAGVRRFIYTSVPNLRRESSSKFFRLKRETEGLIQASGMDSVIFRADVFMDVAFAMMGSAIPLRGAAAATVLRPFAFARNHYQRNKDSIDRDNVAQIPGDGTVRHAFICVDDVARFLAAAAVGGPSGVHTLGGPEALSYLDVVKLFEKVIGANLRVKKTPTMVLRILSQVLRPFNPAAANIMYINLIAATEETFCDASTPAHFRVSLTSAESFLRTKYAIAATA